MSTCLSVCMVLYVSELCQYQLRILQPQCLTESSNGLKPWTWAVTYPEHIQYTK